MTLFPIDPDEASRSGLARARQILDEPAIARATAERDAAMAQVEGNAPPEWVDEALDFVRHYLEQHDELFVDDLWTAGLPRPPQPRALGPVIKRAAANGWMTKSGEHRPSVSSHMIPKPVWRSLIRSAS